MSLALIHVLMLTPFNWFYPGVPFYQ